MQAEAIAAAQMATEVILSNNFTDPLIASTVQITVDINNDGSTDYNAAVTTPACISSTAIMNSSLNFNSASDVPCISSSTASNTGIIFVSAPPSTPVQSWCEKQLWDVPATATSTDGTVNVKTHQGVSLKVPKGTTC